MLNYSNLNLEKLAIHRVGNKHREEENFFSQSLFHTNEEIEEALMHYFIKPLKKSEDIYRFQHTTDLNYNIMYNYAKSIFESQTDFLEVTNNIIYQLYNQSDHPNIKSGEVYIAHFSNLLIDDEVVDAIGIFKSERKSTFLKISEDGENLMVDKLEGIQIDKLDKGCLIINTKQSDGMRVLTIDNNNYDALYWTHHFLNVDYVADENFHTKLYIEMCDEFSKEVIAPQADKKEQVKFMANSVDYFAKHETFDFDDFKEKVIPSEEYASEFKGFQEDFGLDQVDGFEISQPALKMAKRKIKSTIKLDTKIQIKLDFNNPEASNFYIEKDFDDVRGMYFYKVFFNEELD